MAELTQRSRITARFAVALHGHSVDALSQDSGQHCACGSDSRFSQQDGRDLPWADIDEHRAQVAALLVEDEIAMAWTAAERVAVVALIETGRHTSDTARSALARAAERVGDRLAAPMGAGVSSSDGGSAGDDGAGDGG